MPPWYRFGFKFWDYVFTHCFHARVEGRENLPAGGFVAVCNHVSFFDPTTAGWALNREVYYLARKSLFNSPVMAKFLPSVNVLPIDQERPDMTGLRRVIKYLKAGEVVVLFPEGARSWDGTVQPGMPGAGLVAVKAGVPIVPVRLHGTYEIMPRGRSQMRYHPVRIVIGKPFTLPAGPGTEEKKEFYHWASQQMMKAVAELN